MSHYRKYYVFGAKCLNKLNFVAISLHCHCNIPECTKLLNILKFPTGMFMHV